MSAGDAGPISGFVVGGGERWRDPFPMYRWLREHDPVHFVEAGDYWVLSRFADVSAAAIDTQMFSSARGLTFTSNERELVGLDRDATPIVMMDPPEHTEFRRLLARGFTPKRVVELEPAIRAFVGQRIDRLRAAGSGDIVADVFKPLPSFVVAHYLGVPTSDRARFDRWTDAIVAANARGGALGAPEAVGEMIEYFAALAERRRRDPGDDTISDLVRLQAAGVAVSVVQILGYAFTMVAGGNDTTTGLLGGAAVLLTVHLDQREALIEAPDMIPNAVDEFLRLTSPVQGLARTVTHDLDLHGRLIREHTKVLLLFAAANRDPDEFGPTAEDCDVTRNIDRILSFGFGPHHCLGAAVAKLQARVALEELLARCPRFAVDPDEGRYADGSFVRRYASLPFIADTTS
ncbi:MAG: cytochrome P450 [Acidimicrobiia bacterium]